ncbi:glycosyl transferase [Clostridium gelidum]|uniref:Glycosyl transferase n=1 Tax=Clostridium gelidum TaxID=704125 RepID=A0ABN6J5J5_9CLOT|nr:glycosyltransferase [Clostridium gelidum]BCZ49023.1 glycosyl transferase [Clostridium gelidum]
MKVLLLDVNCKSGSTGKIIYDLYTQLNENDHTAAIGYGRGPLVDESNIIKFSSNIEVYIHALLTRITGFTGCFSYFATRRLIKFIDKFKPDVVHLNDMHGYFVNIMTLMKYLKKNNIKTIWTFHCEFMYTGKCGYSYDCEKWKSECGYCPNLKDYPTTMFFDFTKKMFNDKKEIFKDFNNLTIVTPSKWLADRVKQSFLKDKEIVVIHNGIDTKNVFYPRKFEHLKKKHNITNEKIVLAVAPDIMCERKGGRYVLELAKRMKDENVKFILIGVTDLNEKFDDNVIALGRTENQIELAEYYSLADVFIICSKKENFPTTCIEAISCGKPVCGFDEGGTSETAPGKTGSFVDYGEVEQLKEKILLELEQGGNYKLYEQYGKETYTKETMYKNYLKIYR